MSTILIVDDEKNVILPLKLYLKSLGHKIFTASDALVALDIIDKEKLDLIFLDIVLPKMNGFLLCEAIRENLNTHNTPIIFMTAKTDPKDLEKTFEVGGNNYILKPFVIDDISNILKTYLKE